MDYPGLTQLRVHISDARIESELFFAKPLGNDLYEVRSIPLLADEIDFGDVVRARDDGTDATLRVVEVVKKSGHRSITVTFESSVTLEQQAVLLSEMKLYRCGYQRGGSHLVILDIEPEGDAERVDDMLDAWGARGLVEQT